LSFKTQEDVMKKVKAPGARSNVVSTKPLPSPPQAVPTRTLSGPGYNANLSLKNYKKGK